VLACHKTRKHIFMYVVTDSRHCPIRSGSTNEKFRLRNVQIASSCCVRQNLFLSYQICVLIIYIRLFTIRLLTWGTYSCMHTFCKEWKRNAVLSIDEAKLVSFFTFKLKYWYWATISNWKLYFITKNFKVEV
jgi:hypothetical protein